MGETHQRGDGLPAMPHPYPYSHFTPNVQVATTGPRLLRIERILRNLSRQVFLGVV